MIMDLGEGIKLIGIVIVCFTAYIGYRRETAKSRQFSNENNEKVLNKMEKIDKNQSEKIDRLVIIDNERQEQFNRMSRQFEEMKKQISILLDLHKNPNVSDRLIVKLRHTIDFLAQDTHKEIRRTLINALEEITPVFENILATDFSNLEKEVLYEDIKRKAVAIQPKINFKALNISEAKDVFIEILADNIKTDIRSFCNNVVSSSKELTNGERISSFFETCISLITRITEKTITLYDTCKVKS